MEYPIYKAKTLFSILVILMTMSLFGEELTPRTILERVDKTFLGFRDRSYKMKLIISEKASQSETCEIFILEKGRDKRMAKFLAGADKKGIGFLSYSKNLTYVYLPAYKKVRRIASHIKHTKFAGTDFTYEDLEPKNYANDYEGKILSVDSVYYRLELIPKTSSSSLYYKLIISVNRNNFYPEETEYYDKRGRLIKKLTATKVRNIDGFWVAEESIMEDYESKRKTKMILQEIKFNTNLSDEKFTERYLMQ
jgi:outer membrane lipoprotein-sorting protein